MAKFSIEWKESVWYITEIEADTAEDEIGRAHV